MQYLWDIEYEWKMHENICSILTECAWNNDNVWMDCGIFQNYRKESSKQHAFKRAEIKQAISKQQKQTKKNKERTENKTKTFGP